MDSSLLMARRAPDSVTRLVLTAKGDDAMLVRVATVLTHFPLLRFGLEVKEGGRTAIEVDVALPGEDPRAALLARRLARVVGVVDVERRGSS